MLGKSKLEEIFKRADNFIFGKHELIEEEIKIETGIFGEDMKVEIINDGPVTIILDTKDANIK